MNINKLFSLSEAVESNYSDDNVVAYNFISDEIDECAREANAVIHNDHIAIFETYYSANEMILEAALSYDMARASYLIEASGETIKDKATKFIEKLKSIVKGIITKIKAAFYKITGKTTEWHKLMKDKIKDAKNRAGSDKFDYEIYEWDTKYMAELYKKYESLVNSAGVSTDKEQEVDKVKEKIKNIKMGFTTGELNALASKNYQSKTPVLYRQAEKIEDSNNDLVKDVLEDIKEATKKIDDINKDRKEAFPEVVSAAFNLSAASDMSAVWSALDKKVRGESSEKKVVKLHSVCDSYMTFIENYEKATRNLTTPYDKLIKKLEDAKKAVEKAGEDGKKYTSADSKGKNAQIQNAYQTLISTHINNITSEYSDLTTVGNTLSTKVVGYYKSCVTDYMSAMNKFAGVKAEKE